MCKHDQVWSQRERVALQGMMDVAGGTGALTLSRFPFKFCTALVRADWYWASSTTYTTFTWVLPFASGTMRLSSGLVFVYIPPAVEKLETLYQELLLCTDYV